MGKKYHNQQKWLKKYENELQWMWDKNKTKVCVLVYSSEQVLSALAQLATDELTM